MTFTKWTHHIKPPPPPPPIKTQQKLWTSQELPRSFSAITCPRHGGRCSDVRRKRSRLACKWTQRLCRWYPGLCCSPRLWDPPTLCCVSVSHPFASMCRSLWHGYIYTAIQWSLLIVINFVCFRSGAIGGGAAVKFFLVCFGEPLKFPPGATPGSESERVCICSAKQLSRVTVPAHTCEQRTRVLKSSHPCKKYVFNIRALCITNISLTLACLFLF